ncbi:Protein BONZAI 1 [Glycine soja]
MGNCCSDVAGGQSAIGGTAAGHLNPANAPNDAVDRFLRSRGYNGLFSQIELSFSASGLRDRDVLSKSDPMMVLYARGKNAALTELGRTEVILNSLNPTWITKHTLIYNFEVVQVLVFRVYDVDTQFHNIDVKMLKLEEQQYLGEATCALSEIITKFDRSMTLDLHRREDSIRSTQSQNCGKLLVHAEECVSSKTTIEMILRCSDLEYRDLFSRSDPFLLLSKVVEGGSHIPICKTEVIKNDHNPIWKPVFLNIQQVGSKESPLIIECYNFNSNGKHDLMGVVYSCFIRKVQKSLVELEKLYSGGQGENFISSAPAGHNSHNKVLKSQLFVDKFSESIQYSFLDYLAGGFELNFMVAIDFTASNGNPRLPDSLHYIDPSGRPNAYQRAVLEVGEVLQYYDSDKRFPTWGFGARPIDAPVSHCFNLNGSSHCCEVEGIQGIMMAYTSALLNVSLAGPTLFGPVISNAALIASQSVANGGRKYFVLLIITDGVVTDLQETKDALVKASDLPLSILIVGVGGADFKEMEILDADKGERLESSSGRVASRDIVQFVPFRDVQSGEISVVQALLAELPTQFLSYMRSRNILPNS